MKAKGQKHATRSPAKDFFARIQEHLQEVIIYISHSKFQVLFYVLHESWTEKAAKLSILKIAKFQVYCKTVCLRLFIVTVVNINPITFMSGCSVTL